MIARRLLVLGAAIALVAANLRPALASVGPVLSDIRADLGLSGPVAALLTAVPVACLGVFASVAPALARRTGLERALAMAVFGLVAGLVLRVGGGAGVLFTGTIVAASAIAIANVLVPVLVKREFPGGGGTMMGVYTMSLTGAAAIAAGVTVPVEHLSGYGWRGALGGWALPAAIAAVAWLPFARHRAVPDPPTNARRSLLRDPLAWHVTGYFGLQSLSFYAILGWLPTIYRDHGLSAPAAGLVLSVSAVAQMPVALLLPRFAVKAADQRWYVAAATVLTAAALIGVLLYPSPAYLWAVVLGWGQGAAFAAGLTLFVVRTGASADTARLSAMAQSFGYLIAAGGPFLVGAVHDLAGGWTAPLLLLIALLVPQLIVGLLAARARLIGRVD
jgi:CP family cyanate transporter-like MFS transporter